MYIEAISNITFNSAKHVMEGCMISVQKMYFDQLFHREIVYVLHSSGLKYMRYLKLCCILKTPSLHRGYECPRLIVLA